MANPTNTEVIKEVRVLQKQMGAFDARLRPLEQWKIAFDAADAAISKFKLEHPESQKPAMARIDKDFLKIIAQLLTLFSTTLGLLYLLIQYITK